MVPLPNKPWFWVSEAADYLCVTDRTVRRWITDGRIITILNGPPYRISHEELTRHLSSEVLEHTRRETC